MRKKLLPKAPVFDDSASSTPPGLPKMAAPGNLPGHSVSGSGRVAMALCPAPRSVFTSGRRSWGLRSHRVPLRALQRSIRPEQREGKSAPA